MQNVRQKQGETNWQDTLKDLVHSLVCRDRGESEPWQAPDVFGGGIVWGTFTDTCTSSKKKVQTT